MGSYGVRRPGVSSSAGTLAVAAFSHDRRWVLIASVAKYAALAKQRVEAAKAR